MPISLRPVTRDDLSPLFKLKVAPDQQAFVAPNEYSLAQVHYETGATPYVIWSGDTRVGFCQVIDMRKHAHREPEDDADALFLWRLMIGRDHQGHGHGRAAMTQLFDMAKQAGHSAFETSVVVENTAATAFYLSLGLVKTGRIVDGEAQLRRPLV